MPVVAGQPFCSQRMKRERVVDALAGGRDAEAGVFRHHCLVAVYEVDSMTNAVLQLFARHLRLTSTEQSPSLSAILQVGVMNLCVQCQGHHRAT